MPSRWIRTLTALDIEERFLNGGCLVALIGVFLPWISGEWLGGDNVTYSGVQFYTAFLGLAVLLMQVAILLITIVPLATGTVLIPQRNQESVRFLLSMQSTVLLLATLSVLTKVTFEFSRIEIRFGVYVALIGSIVASIYAFLRFQQQRRTAAHDLFRHPDDVAAAPLQQRTVRAVPQPPPPPPPLEPEIHHPHHG